MEVVCGSKDYNLVTSRGYRKQYYGIECGHYECIIAWVNMSSAKPAGIFPGPIQQWNPSTNK
jgi:hypothetical protein